MRNHSITIGLSVTFLCTMASLAFAQTVEPNSGFLQQADPTFMNAPPVPASLYPTLLQEVRAANLLIHQVDTLEIGSPEYRNAHRLLLQNLEMMERQLHFNPADLARFNSESHPARSTADQTIYSRDDGSSTAVNTGAAAFFPDTAVFSDNGFNHTYTGSAPSRRSIVAAAEEQNRLRALVARQ